MRQISQWVHSQQTGITATITFFVVLLFTYTAASKLLEVELFYRTLTNFPLVISNSMASVVAWATPIAELLVALLAAFPRTRRYGLMGALALLMLFSAYVTYLLFFSPFIPCSCGGITELLSWNQQLYFNLGSIVLVLYGLKIETKQKKQYKDFIRD